MDIYTKGDGCGDKFKDRDLHSLHIQTPDTS